MKSIVSKPYLPNFRKFFGICFGAALLTQIGIAVEKPNIIVLLADDLGYSDLSCYRNQLREIPEHPLATSNTPNLDQLASQGMRFTDFYSGSAVCSPSRAALLTGRNNNRVGIFNWIPPQTPMHLPLEEWTLPEMLQQQGYRTAHFGKWHLTAENTPIPTAHGFETAFWTHNNARPSHQNPENFLDGDTAIGTLNGYSCQIVMDRALHWLETQDSGSPFYLNVWFHEPHEPVAAPPEFASRHDRMPDYYGCIENMDHQIGRLLSWLDETGLSENTLILFSSDNGSQVMGSNEPLRGEKCFNWEGGIRVPFIVRWPQHIPAGRVSNVPGYFPDILPTLSSILEVNLPSDRIYDGTSLREVWFKDSDNAQREEPIFFYRYFHDPICMLRDGDWLLLGYQNPPEPYRENYDEYDLALIKPEPDKPKWSKWGFQASHMRMILDQEPHYFELYQVSEDIGQRQNVFDDHPDRSLQMVKQMKLMQRDVVNEGSQCNWY